MPLRPTKGEKQSDPILGPAQPTNGTVQPGQIPAALYHFDPVNWAIADIFPIPGAVPPQLIPMPPPANVLWITQGWESTFLSAYDPSGVRMPLSLLQPAPQFNIVPIWAAGPNDGPPLMPQAGPNDGSRLMPEAGPNDGLPLMPQAGPNNGWPLMPEAGPNDGPPLMPQVGPNDGWPLMPQAGPNNGWPLMPQEMPGLLPFGPPLPGAPWGARGAPFAIPPDGMAMPGIAAAPLFASTQFTSTLASEMATAARSGTLEYDIRWMSENISPAGAVPGTATVSVSSESPSFDTSSAPINRDSLSVNGEIPYRTRTAAVPEIDLADDAGQEPSVLGDMGQVERAAPAEPILASGAQPTEFLDIVALDASLQNPCESVGAVPGILVNREELALDRVMGQTSVFGLDSSGAIPVTAQDNVVAQDDATATAGLSATTQPASATEALTNGRDQSASPSWWHHAASGVVVMLLACDELYFGKRQEEDDERSSRRSV